MHIRQEKDTPTHTPRTKRELVKKKRPTKKQQGTVYVTKQDRGKGKGPEPEHCARRVIRLLK